MISKRYLEYILNPFELLSTKKVLKVNPTVTSTRIEPEQSTVVVYDYTKDESKSSTVHNIADTFPFLDSPSNTWINIDGLIGAEVEQICAHYNIHALIAEDILSVGQRAKTDEINELLYCVLPMLYYNERYNTVELEQVSIILGKNFIISFQDDASRDVFKPLRDKLLIQNSKVRQNGADFLYYSLIDLIVDHYYVVMEKLADKMEMLEENIVRNANKRTLAQINMFRKEMILFKRSISPVRDLVNGILRSESDLIDEKTEKYFKDVYDHIVQANELADNYRDMMMNLQDLYLSNVNLRMNEVMKVMAIVTCLLAPATVIGGIFGMNFELIPISHQANGFYIAVGLMVGIGVLMILIFKKRGWF